MDIQKQVDYWRSGSEEDLAAARSLFAKRHFRHALFFAELTVEKLLKAHVAKATQNVAPKIHDLLRLAEIARIPLSDERRAFLARFQQYCLEGRYPEFQPPAPSRAEAKIGLREAEEAAAWLTNLLS